MQPRRHHLSTRLILLLLAVGCFADQPPEGPFSPVDITLKEHGDLKELLDEQLVFIDNQGVEWTAPKGTLTDGASVPRLALPVTDGRFSQQILKAAVVHDAYCQKENATRCPKQYRKRPWRDVHKMFYEACIAGGTPALQAKIMFAAVWLAGPRWGDPAETSVSIPNEYLTMGFSGSKEFIQKNDPTIEEITAEVEQRRPILSEVARLDQSISSALGAGDTSLAQALLGEQEELLSNALERRPTDSMLLNSKGYLYKHRASLYERLGKTAEQTSALARSEEAFQAVLATVPNDPSALSGLGSIAIMQKDFDKARSYVEEALAVAPDSAEAARNFELLEKREASPPQ